MVHYVDDSNFFKHIVEHKRIIWFFFRKGQENSGLTLKPFIEEIPSQNLELSKVFTGATFFQTYIEDNPKIMEYFNLMDEYVWNYKDKSFIPRVISVKNGVKYYDQTRDKCYCIETVIEMMFDLFPELIPKPTSE